MYIQCTVNGQADVLCLPPYQLSPIVHALLSNLSSDISLKLLGFIQYICRANTEFAIRLHLTHPHTKVLKVL